MRFSFLMVVAFVGCRTANYTAANLPEALRVQPVPVTKGINLARLNRGGSGTSQLGPGDLVEVTIVSGTGDEEVKPIPARVANDGTVMVPLIGAVNVTGLEPFAAEQQIAAAAVERGIYRQPYVTLRVEQQAVNRVTVMGAVSNPGVVELPRGASDLLAALAAAGGLSDEASTQVDILRHDRPSMVAGEPSQSDVVLASYNSETNAPFAPPGLITPASETSAPGTGAQNPSLQSPTARVDLAQVDRPAGINYQLGDRDVVMVLPKEKRVIHVTGLVHKPDQFEIPADKDVRVLDAIALAGGLKSPVADKVFLIRQFPDMPKPAVIRISIASAKRHGDHNLRLAAGDLVSVEATATTMVVDTATNFFRVAIGLSGNIITF
jgi:polysaccharide export outer membrane protein